MNKQRIFSIMMVVFALLFLLSAGMLLAYYGEGMRQQQAFRELERITEQADDWGGETSENAAVQTELSAEEKAAREYNALHEKNPDFWSIIFAEILKAPIHCAAYRFWTADVTTAAATTSSMVII